MTLSLSLESLNRIFAEAQLVNDEEGMRFAERAISKELNRRQEQVDIQRRIEENEKLMASFNVNPDVAAVIPTRDEVLEAEFAAAEERRIARNKIDKDVLFARNGNAIVPPHPAPTPLDQARKMIRRQRRELSRLNRTVELLKPFAAQRLEEQIHTIHQLAYDLSKRNKELAENASLALTGLMASIQRKKAGFTEVAVEAAEKASAVYDACLALNNETLQVIAGYLDLKVETGEVAP